MLVYISGGITNNPNYEEDFRIGEEWLKLNDYTPINPTKLNDALPNDFTYEKFMKIDYALIDISDAIFMLKGWQKSKGACAELAYAKSIGKVILYQKYFKEFRAKENK
jgi:hypothetical protein